MDKSWIHKSRLSNEYFEGVERFLKFAFENASQDGKILCPCLRCVNGSWKTYNVVEEHLVCNGFLMGYTDWVFHGEWMARSPYTSNSFIQESSSNQDFTCMQVDSSVSHDMRGLLRDAFGIFDEVLNDPSQELDETEVQQPSDEFGMHSPTEGFDVQQPTDGPSKEATMFNNLVRDGEVELYPGCKKFSKLSFIIHLFHLKCLNGWSGKSFTMLLELLKDAFPEGVTLPISSNETKKVIKELGLGYEKIHSCPNDCMLYWGERANQETCHVCGASRWKINKYEDDEPNYEANGSENMKKKPSKILRYFPLIPRLQRLFMSSKTAPSMRWHDEGRTKDGMLRHPADSLAWKDFDARYPDFASDARNVRLALASDGFNPFGTMSSTYSIWPVVLIPYNLPPWICMKQPSLILSMIIPGKKGPGNDIDVYLQPLIAELKLLWEVGIQTYDASQQETFCMRATLMWTINDFPAYANLSGWSTKGMFACPCCAKWTCSRWLDHGKKYSYMGHRRWLDDNHRFRFQKQYFDGTEEFRHAPIPLSGTDVLKELQGVDVTFGKHVSKPVEKKSSKSTAKRVRTEKANKLKGKKTIKGDGKSNKGDDGHKKKEGPIWKKRSIFFELPYWEFNRLRHNLDVMHIEKNVCDNVIGTLLNLGGKSKDNLKARLDLVDLGIRHELHPQHLPNNKLNLPPACYSMSTKGKEIFCKVLKDVKVPDGYASNISRCVNLQDRKLLNLKSHDSHILLEELLPLALRSSMPKEVTSVLIELSSFFKELCYKVLDVHKLEELESRIALTLCQMEKIFPPSFFTIMVHLSIHLASEAKVAGPLQYRHMYPIERFLRLLKSFVSNKAQPEGSIAEGYLANECLTFCSRYLKGVETRFNRPLRQSDVDNEARRSYMFSTAGEAIGAVEGIMLDDKSWIQAHRYVLRHCDAIQSFRDEYIATLKREMCPRRLNVYDIEKSLNENFLDWFQTHVSKMGDQTIREQFMWLASGPNKVVQRFTGFSINGVRFLTKYREDGRKTQNSGVAVVSNDDVTYFGALTNIIELSYFNGSKVVLFRCNWVDVTRATKEDHYGFTLVNFSRLIHTGQHMLDEPYVFASQAQQVFYVQDPEDKNWSIVIRTKPRDLFDMGDVSHIDDVDKYCQSMPYSCQNLNDSLEDYPHWVRNDIDD